MKPHIKMKNGFYRLYHNERCYASARTLRELIYFSHEYIIFPQAGNDLGSALGAPEKQSPAKNRASLSVGEVVSYCTICLGVGILIGYAI
jgi:hypothetical protein